MTKKLILIAMLTVVLALCFTGCPAEKPQKTIIVTSIPSSVGYNYGYVGLVSGSNDVVAVSLPVPVSGGQITCDLLTLSGSPFTDEGTYSVALIITRTSDPEDSVYSGAALNKKITDEVTTISFGSFTPVSSKVTSLQLKQLLEK